MPPQPVDTDLHHKEVETEIFACLEAAPLRQTLAFILREVEELSTEDICHVLGDAVGARGVAAVARRAIRPVRSLLRRPCRSAWPLLDLGSCLAERVLA